MLSAEKIRSKTFNRAIRGYNPEEVDKYLEFLGEKYEELLRENRELEFKLASIPDYDGEENPEQTLIAAKATADRIISEAEKDAELLYNTAKDNTEKQLRKFRERIAKEAIIYKELKKCVSELKDSIYNIYRQNLEQIAKASPESESEAIIGDAAVQSYLDGVIDGMMKDIAKEESQKLAEKKKEEDFSDQVKIRRTREFSTSSKFKIASVKDTIKELNKQILFTESEKKETEQ